MIKFPHDIIPCLPRDNYGAGRAPATYVLRSLKGRARYRWRDEFPSYTVSVTLDLSQTQYATWQQFYRSIGNGVDWFLMDLDFGGGVQEKQVHVISPPNGTVESEHRWKAQLQLEVKM